MFNKYLFKFYLIFCVALVYGQSSGQVNQLLKKAGISRSEAESLMRKEVEKSRVLN